MANVIQIKHGSGAPSSSALASNELGFDTTNNALYIGKGSSVVRLAPFDGSSGGTITTTGQIIRAGNGGSWCEGRDKAMIKMTPIESGGYCPILSIKTTNGSWEIGEYDHSGSYDNLMFNYITDTDYSGGTNQRTAWMQFLSNNRIQASAITLTSTTDASPSSDTSPGLIIGSTTGTHLAIDNNEILCKSNATTPSTLYLQDGTGTVSVAGTGGLYVPSGGISKPTTSGNNITYNWISAGGGYGTGSGKSGLKLICCEQSDGTSGIGQDLTGLSYELCIAASESTSNVAYITFAKHKLASPTSYTRLGHFDSSGNFNVIGTITAPSGNIWAGTDGNTTSERQVGVQSGAGRIYLFSQASTSAERGIYLSAHGADTSGKYVFRVNKDNYITYTGGTIGASTMSGVLTMQANQYTDSYSGALNMNNSDIYGLNSIYTADTADNAAEGIHFYRDSTHVDSLWVNGGEIMFVPNRALGTGTTKANSQKVARYVYSSSQPTGAAGLIWLKPIS